eukprot:TRINITY_DN2111_c0_g1_i1.p1 TRINITY_DN2111_c0_g1~~TRINITY_DN2111_c0_g1_i1.p1  ORF type:complete len:397 (-),score=44.90 TRINITY_DN2111_c0_g1_i1:5-1072(-)
MTYGLLSTIYGLAQLIGSPIMGRLSDERGRKYVLLISFIGSCFGYLGLALSSNLWMLFLSRIPVGLVKQTVSVSKAYISDVSDEKARARNMGFLGTAMGLGFIIGPMVGGIMSQWGQDLPAYFAAFLFVIDSIFVVVFMQEPPGHRSKARTSNSIFNFDNIAAAMRTDLLRTMLLIQFMYSLGMTLFRSNFSVFAQYQFGLTPRENGFIMSYVGLLDVLTSTFAIGFLTRRFSEHLLIYSSIIFSSFCYMALSMTTTISQFYVLLCPFVLSSSIIKTCMASSITKIVRRDEIGMTLGVSDSLDSLSRVIGPTLGGLMMEYFGTSSPLLLSGILTLSLGVFVRSTLHSAARSAVSL